MKLFLFFLTLFWTHSTVRAAGLPNILWLTLEDTSPHFIGCYGNAAAKTPNIDRLAARGIRFNRAFANSPVCSAARSSLIIGTVNTALGTGNHRSFLPLPDTIKGFPSFMRTAGYATFNNFKTDYATSSAERLIGESWEECSKQAGWWRRKDDQTPFFAVINFEASHQSRTMKEPYPWYEKNVLGKLSPSEQIADTAFPLPPFLPETPEIRHSFARVYNSISLADVELGSILNRLETDGLMDDTIIFCYADHGEAMPRGKTNPIALGYRVPFIIVFPEKWQKLNPWGAAGSTCEELLAFDDLAPTLLSLAGQTPAPWMTGRAFLGPHRSKPKPYVFGARNRIDESPGCARSITDGRFLYTRRFLPLPEIAPQKYADVSDIARSLRSADAAGTLTPIQSAPLRPSPPEVLYDLANDPWETHNLAADPAHTTLKETLRSQLFDHILTTGDVLFLPEFELAKISTNGTAYEYGQAMSAPRRRAILETADLASRPEADPRLLELIRSEDSIVAYWASIGLRLHPGLDSRTLALSDFKYPPVRLNLAAARLQQTDDAEAISVINEAAKPGNPHLRLLSYQLIQSLVPRARIFESTLRAALTGGPSDVRQSAEVTLHLLGLGPLSY